jgi:16S rRNA processing protein RimM
MKPLVLIGSIIRTHGFKGHVVLNNKIDNIDKVFLNDRPYAVTEIKQLPKATILKLETIDTELDAKKLKGVSVHISRAELETLDDNEFFESDLLDFKAFDHKKAYIGKFIGIEIIPGSTDRWWFETEKDKFAVLGSQHFIEQVDTHNQSIYLKNLDELL